MQQNKLVDDGKRQMRICNACRYCEGYCAVWRAIERHRDFSSSDLAYLANLCHDCRDCYFACPFTTPHVFDINPPKLFSDLREKSYRQYAWPSAWAKTFGDKHSGFWMVAVIGIALLLAIVLATNGVAGIWMQHVGTGAFYQLISETVLEGLFGLLGLWMVGGWALGAWKFWRDIRPPQSDKIRGKDVATAISYALSLRYLGGDGADCTTHSDELPRSRRWLHHLVFYGFLLDFSSTTLGAFYSHFLYIQAPYPWYNPVVILGVLGGIGIIIGIWGLLVVKKKNDQLVTDTRATQSGTSFSVALLTVAMTGMVLLVFRDTAAMGMILVVHLGSVAALFFTAPYSKFAHFVYRFLALVRYAQEERVTK